MLSNNLEYYTLQSLLSPMHVIVIDTAHISEIIITEFLRSVGRLVVNTYVFVTASAATIVRRTTAPLKYNGRTISYLFADHIRIITISDL